MEEFDTYIFDFDGTLVDSEYSLFHVFQVGFAEIGRTCTREQSAHYMHQSLLQTIEEAKIPEADQQRFLEAITTAINAPETNRLIVPFAETKEVMEALLKRGKHVAIASNNIVPHIRDVLEIHGLVSLFQAFAGSDRVKHTKPAPDLVELICQDLHVPCDQRVVYVGDSLQDVETGLAAHASAILVDRENTMPEFVGTKISSLRDLLI